MAVAILRSVAGPSTEVGGACFIPTTVSMLTPILASRNPARLLALHKNLLVILPIVCFVAGFLLFLLVVSPFRTLAGSTSQGSKLMCKLTTKKVCVVKGNTLKFQRKRRCVVRATAPVVPGTGAFSPKYSIKVK